MFCSINFNYKINNKRENDKTIILLHLFLDNNKKYFALENRIVFATIEKDGLGGL